LTGRNLSEKCGAIKRKGAQKSPMA